MTSHADIRRHSDGSPEKISATTRIWSGLAAGATLGGSPVERRVALTPTSLNRVSALLLAATFGISKVPAAHATIEALGLIPGHVSSAATAVSDDGQLVVGNASTRDGWDSVNTNPRYVHAFIWTPALGSQPLPSPSGSDQPSRAEAMSADGAIVVGAVIEWNRVGMPVRWLNRQPVPLALPSGSGGGAALNISRDGLVVLGYADDDSIVRWMGDLAPTRTFPASFPPRRKDLAISSDGSVVAFVRPGTRIIHRWTPTLADVPMRVSPAAYTEDHPRPFSIILSGDGSRLLGAPFEPGGSSVAPVRPGRVFVWNGLEDGQPLPVHVSGLGTFHSLVANSEATLLAGTTSQINSRDGGRGWVIAPFGALPFAQLLTAQGADVSEWSSLTNISALSSDGRWVVGAGRTAGSPSEAGREQAFRAELSLHADGDPNLEADVLLDTLPQMVRLRWPATDLLVAVESAPFLSPEIPWAPETGLPQIDGTNIVLTVELLTEDRAFRLRRLQ